MKPSLQLRLGHQLTMTPQLQQAIRLLQLSALDLKTEIQTALETNTMLELNEVDLHLGESDIEEDEQFFESNDLESQDLPWEIRGGTTPSRHDPEFESYPSSVATLKEHLLWQMHLTPFNEIEQFIATTIIDAIQEDGFLGCALQEIVTTLKPITDVTEDEILAVLHRIQQFDPIGVGARDLSECLALQLDQLGEFKFKDKARDLIRYHLSLLGRRDYPALKRRLGLSFDDLSKVVQIIQSLNPRPGTQISTRIAEYLIPDVFAYKKRGKWHVELNGEEMPNLQINHTYASLIQHCHSNADNQFLRAQLQEARWFLKSIENRNETLLKVAQCIVARQQGFLDYGAEAMKPLILHDIAEELALHESTISRVTTQKYLYTPRGTFELKYFFSSHVNTRAGGECSATAIRALIKKLICAENPKKPLSDSKLAKLLEEQGIQVARRTIAKYREAASIPPSNERKQLF